MSLSQFRQPDDILDVTFVGGTITVGTSAVEAKVGGSALVGRNILSIYNSSAVDIYYGPSGVTTATGFLIASGGVRSFKMTEGIALYLIAGTAGNTVRVQEYA